MIRLVVDAMGSDNAPEPEVLGVVEALKANPDLRVSLVGEPARIKPMLPASLPAGLELVEAASVVQSHEKATKALRHKRDSSIAIGLREVGQAKADGFISAGNTGAVMAFAMKELGLIPGVERPGIAAFFPRVQGGYNLIIDVGATVDTKPNQLEQFAIMGSVVYQHMFGVKNPSVGLLNLGEEAVKGNSVVLKTRELLEKRKGLNFTGYVEGHELLCSKAHVVVTDGFVGNVVLKFGEGVVSALFKFLKQEVRSKPEALLGGLLMKRAITGLRSKVDFEEYGGAPLLGVNGLVLICHGRSSPRAVKNATRTLSALRDTGLIEHMREEIAKTL